MEQAMIGLSPNPLILSYLKYAVSSQVRNKTLIHTDSDTDFVDDCLYRLIVSDGVLLQCAYSH